MKNVKTFLIVIPSIVALAGIVGFLITYPSSTQAAWARIFIDIGSIIALISICRMLPKPTELRTEDIVDGLRDLARGRYDRRIRVGNLGDLENVAQAFNELAGTLSDTRDPNVSHIRYQYAKRSEPEVKAKEPEFFSHHPELGKIEPITKIDTHVEPVEEVPSFVEASLVPDPVPEVPHVQEHISHIQEATSLKPNETVLASQNSDFYDLYAHFCELHHSQNQEPIPYEEFKLTIDKAREDLLAAHQCREIRFEVVLESGAVALRPRLVR